MIHMMQKQVRRLRDTYKETFGPICRCNTQETVTNYRLNAFARSCLCNATAVAAQCHSQQTNSQSLARRHHQVRNV